MSQFRNSPFLNIEIHDRDECENTRRRVGSVFGSESTDENIGRVSGNSKLKLFILFYVFIYNRENKIP
jgi:hypothetical protein